MGFNGITRGVKAWMYAENKRQQQNEWFFLQKLAVLKGIEIDLPSPLETRISVKAWDKKLEAAVALLGFRSMNNYWNVKAGTNSVRAARFLHLFKIISQSKK